MLKPNRSQPQSRSAAGEVVVAVCLASSVALCALTFAADMLLPTGIAAGVPYILPVILTRWVPGAASTVALTLVGIVLTVLGYLLSGAGGEVWPPVINRAMAVGAVAAIAVLVLVRKRADRLHRESERNFSQIVDTIPGMVWVMDPSYSLVYLNPYLREVMGVAAEDEVSTRWMDIVHPEDLPRLMAIAEDHFETIRPFEAQFRLAKASGGYMDVLARGRPYFSERGEHLGFISTGLDVTEQVRTEGELRDQQRFLSRAQELAAIGSWIWEPGSGEVQWSEQMYRIVGIDRPPDTAGIASFGDTIVHPEDREAFNQGWEDLLKTRSPRASYYRIIRPDGEVRHVHAECDVVVDNKGEVLRILGTTQDVTEERAAREAISKSRERLAYAEHVARLGHTEWDIPNRKEVWSDGLFRLLGFEPGEFEPDRQAFLDTLVAEEDRERLIARRDKIAAGEVEPGATYRIRRKDGIERELEITGQVFRDAAGQVVRVFATAQDVTELREAERALRSSEERFELTARGANDGLWDWPDISVPTLWFSPRFYELLGFEDQEFEANGDNFFSMIHPEDLDRALSAILAHIGGEQDYDVELRIGTKSGEYRWYRSRGAMISASNGAPIRMAGSLQDVHGRRTAELELEHQREQLRQLAAQAALASEKERRRIGAELHDRTIQNLGITKVKLGALRKVLYDAGEATRYQELAALVDTTIQDARALLSEISPPVLTELGFEAAVDWLAERAEGQYGVQCTVTDDGEPRTLDDDAQLVLFQTVRELLANVGKHAKAASAHVQISGGSSQVVVRVQDDGVGFEVDHAEDTAIDEGGYGLFSIRERLRMLGGELQIDSRPETGTTVVVSVPIRH